VVSNLPIFECETNSLPKTILFVVSYVGLVLLSAWAAFIICESFAFNPVVGALIVIVLELSVLRFVIDQWNDIIFSKDKIFGKNITNENVKAFLSSGKQ